MSDNATREESDAALLGHSMVVVADDPRNFPCAVFALPQMNELPFADCLCVLMSRVVKTMNSNLHRAIALHVIHLQRPRNEFPGHSAADIPLYALGQCRSAQGYST
jgi:hypothetical protein